MSNNVNYIRFLKAVIHWNFIVYNKEERLSINQNSKSLTSTLIVPWLFRWAFSLFLGGNYAHRFKSYN